MTGRVTDLISTNPLEGGAGNAQFGNTAFQPSPLRNFSFVPEEVDERVWQSNLCCGSSCEEPRPKYVGAPDMEVTSVCPGVWSNENSGGLLVTARS